MPYYHIKDAGLINFWSRKCEECGKKWSILSYFYPKAPKGMVWKKSSGLVIRVKKGDASYAAWADRFPGAGVVASRLPNWPRWLRVLTILTFISVSMLVIIWFLNS